MRSALRPLRAFLVAWSRGWSPSTLEAYLASQPLSLPSIAQPGQIADQTAAATRRAFWG